MKTLFVTLAALVVSSAAAFAQVEPFYGCEVEPIPGTNAFQFVDATCAAAVTQNTTDYEVVLIEVPPMSGNFVETTVPTNNK